MQPPPPPPVQDGPPTTAWVSLGSGLVAVLFLFGPMLFGVFGLTAAVAAVVSGWQVRAWVPARIGITGGFIAGAIMLPGMML